MQPFNNQHLVTLLSDMHSWVLHTLVYLIPSTILLTYTIFPIIPIFQMGKLRY